MKDFLENLNNKFMDLIHNIKFTFEHIIKSFATDKERKNDSEHSTGLKERIDSWLTGSRAVPVLFIALAVLVVALVIVLILGGGSGDSSAGSVQHLMDKIRSKNVIKCNISSVNDFFSGYYDALSKGDSQTLDTFFDFPDKARYSIETSDIIDKYSDLTVYVIPGINDGDIAAFVYNNIYFNNIATAAPSVDSYYIRVDQDRKKIYIKTDMYTDNEINDYLTLVSYRQPVRSLLSSTEDTLYGILEKNSELRNLYVIMTTMTEQE